jgi:hypothetical protein
LITLAVCLGLGIPAACEPGRTGSTDADGIPLVELVLELRIDGYEADLVPVGWMGVSPAGDVVLLQQQDRSLKFFDPRGNPLGSIGGEGEGPGEFRWPTSGGWIGDTLWIRDANLGRLTLFSPEREFVRTIAVGPIARTQPSGPENVETFLSVTPYGLLSGDSLLVSASQAVDGARREQDLGFPLLIISKEGVVDRRVAFLPIYDDLFMVKAQVGNGVAFGQIPFADGPDWAVGSSGERIAVVTAATIGSAPGYRLQVADALGQELVDRTYPVTPVPIPTSVLDSAIFAASGRAPAAARNEIARKLREAVPASYPATEAVLIGTDHRVWIRLRGTVEGTPWIILAPDGKPVGRVVSPKGVSLHVAGEARVWGLERDEYGVQSVVRYGLQTLSPR